MRIGLLCMLLAAAACASASLAPVSIRLREDTCAHCRMTLLSIRTAAQIVSAQDEPIIFDEIECLREYLRSQTPPPGARIYVADHRSGEWIDASSALFTRSTAATPMSSGILAHADAASRDADPDARHGAAIKVLP